MTSKEDPDQENRYTHFLDNSFTSPEHDSFQLEDRSKYSRDRSATVNETLLPESRSSLTHSAVSKKHEDPPLFVHEPPFAYESSGLVLQVCRAWWKEIGCMLIVIASLLAVVVTLSTHQGQPLPHWPYGISVNSVISIYVIILKAAMLLAVTEGISQMKFAWFQRPRSLKDLHYFDRGSRGPYGALQLIWNLRHRNLVATIGALIVLFALIIDPMAQLLVRYHGCTIEVSSSTAHIPLKNSFSEIGPHAGAGFNQVPYSLRSSINAGLFNPESVKIPFGCETGNCTFDEVYSTLGYCHTCQDLSKELTTTCVNTTFNETEVYGVPEDPHTPEMKLLRCNTTLPDSLGGVHNLDFAQTTDYLTMVGKSNHFTLVASNLTEVYAEDGLVGNCSTAAENATAAWSCNDRGAAVCSLDPCIRSYKARVNNNQLVEDFLGSHTDFGYDNFLQGSSSIDTRCLDNQTKQELMDIGYIFNGTFIPYYGAGMYGNNTSNKTDSQRMQHDPNYDPYTFQAHPNVTIPPKCLFQFSSASIMSMTMYLGKFFNGSVSTQPNDNYWYIVESTGIQLEKFYNSGNMSFEYVDGLFQNVADSMTAYIRQSTKAGAGAHMSYDDKDMPATGKMFKQDTCIEVRWRFMALPIILVILMIIFLVAMIVETVSRNNRPWKSSSLALLFSGLESDQKEREADSIEQIEHEAEGMKVRLRRTGKGWKFVED